MTIMIFYMTLQQHKSLELTQTFFGGEGDFYWGFGLNIDLKCKCIVHLPVPYEELVKLVPFAIFFSYMCKPFN